MCDKTNRDKIVVNGCSGGCCEAFTLPVHIEDLQANDTAIKEGKRTFVDTQGRSRTVINDNTRETVLDMLIHKYDTTVDPQFKDPDHLEKRFGHLTDDQLFDETYGFCFRKDGKIHVRVFTCKHFDTENKVCTNYENRPHLCRQFGTKCSYEGCGYAMKCAGMNEYTDPFEKDVLETNMGAFLSQGDTCGTMQQLNKKHIEQMEHQEWEHDNKDRAVVNSLDFLPVIDGTESETKAEA